MPPLYEPYYQQETTTAPPYPVDVSPPFAPEHYEPVPPNYQLELKRIAGALEQLVNRPAIGFSVPRRCIVCERMGMQDGFTLGYGSANDGEWVCDDCIHRLVDAEVKGV